MSSESNPATGSPNAPLWGMDVRNLRHPAPRGRSKSCLIRFLVVAVLLAGAAWWLLRERWSRENDIKLADGKVLHVEQSSSQWRYIGFGHAGGFGGGDVRRTLKFTCNGKEYDWSGNSIPVVLQMDGKHPVLITFDRETDFAKITFRYFRWDGSFRELPLKSFPRPLAIQNSWINDEEKAALIAGGNPADIYFRRSLLARLRHCIVRNEQYWQMQSSVVDQTLLETFAREDSLPPYAPPPANPGQHP